MNKTETAKKTAKTIIHTLIAGTAYIIKTTATELNNLNTNTKTNKCPKCHQPKNPKYQLCYKCHRKQKQNKW